MQFLKRIDMNPDRPLKLTCFFRVISVLMLCFILIVPAAGQPSGGPYGPVRQSWPLPETKGKIFFVSPDGNRESTGETLSVPTTIEAAIEKVRTGDVIVMRGGTYRTGDLILNQGITIQPYLDEQPIVKGSYIAGGWMDLGNGLWTIKWDRLFPSAPADWWQRNRSGKETPTAQIQ